MTYRPYTCADCGDPLSAAEVANESRTYVEGTAHTRVRSVRRYCRECNAVNEYRRHVAMRQNVDETLLRLAVRAVATGAARSLAAALVELTDDSEAISATYRVAKDRGLVA